MYDTKTITIITAVHPPRARFLGDTARSVASVCASPPEGWGVEWVVVIDGPGDVPAFATTTNTVVIHRPMNGGVSAARNTGLAHASGAWVMPLDHDDILDADGLAGFLADPRAITEDWAAGSPRLLSGEWTPHRIVEARRYAPRALETAWTSPFPFHPNVVMARRDAALSVGGWPALSANQNLGYVFALNRQTAGWALPYPLTGYRRWGWQTVSQAYYPDMKRLDFSYLIAWINAERGRAGLPSVVAPGPGGSHAIPVTGT